MITSFDDYCIHQTALPVAEPSQSDRNFYDRYWFNGIEETEGSWLFEVGFGLYPNRRVMDGHFSVAIGNKQYAFHASRRAPRERKETVVGPLSVEIVEPMRQVRVKLTENEHNIECDLLFTAASVPHQEPANVMHDDGHLIMHNSRFTQMGTFEDRDGRPTQVSADVVPLHDNPDDLPKGEHPGSNPKTDDHHQINWAKGTRRADTVEARFTDKEGNTWEYSLETGQRFYMLGIGYNHFEWGHAYWKGELETGREEWNLDEVNELDYQFIHTHQAVKSTLKRGEETLHGVGTFESVVIGRHARSGFKDFFDGAQ